MRLEAEIANIRVFGGIGFDTKLYSALNRTLMATSRSELNVRSMPVFVSSMFRRSKRNRMRFPSFPEHFGVLVRLLGRFRSADPGFLGVLPIGGRRNGGERQIAFESGEKVDVRPPLVASISPALGLKLPALPEKTAEEKLDFIGIDPS